MAYDLDYEQMIYLDAEDLAEAGIGQAYERLLPELRRFVPQPATVEELLNHDTMRYSVRCRGKEYPIYSPELSEESGGSWGRATAAIFSLVNEQLLETEFRFYAISGGNDLGGMFLTQTQVDEARIGLPNRRDWPYIPTDEPPWYGEFHDERKKPWWKFWG